MSAGAGGARHAWRLCRRRFADLTGHGARLYGGRWNGPGRPVLYLASTAALCVLEVRVHLDLPFDLLPDDYVLMTVDLDGLEIERAPDDVREPADFGDRWLGEARTPLLEVPSAIVTESANLLLNPIHPAAARVRIETMRPFTFDARLWREP